MKNLLIALTLIIFAIPAFSKEEAALDALVPDEPVLEEDLMLESEVETTKDLTHEKFFKRLSENIKNDFKLEIERTDIPSTLLKETLTFNYEKGPVESIHIWTGMKFNMSENIDQNGDNSTLFKVGLVNNFIDGKFRGGKENFRIMLDTTPQNDRPFMQNLFQDLYVDTYRIPHHRILIGNSRPAVGHEGAGSSYTLPLASRSQISRNFGTVRKLGIRVMGNYSFVDYDLGGYSSGTFFSSFFPGAEFDGWVNVKPLAKTNGKYGKLTLGGGVTAGSMHSKDFFVTGAYIGYEYKKFWAKAEWANANGSNGLSGFSTKNRQGWYATVGYKLTKKLELIARYDEFDPDKRISNNNIREYTAGINYYLKGQALKLILNYVFCQNQAGRDSHRIIFGTQIAI